MERKDIPNALFDYRARNNLSLEEFAKKVDSSASVLSRIETGNYSALRTENKALLLKKIEIILEGEK